MLDISIVLYNSKQHIKPLIKSIIAQDIPLSDISLLVCDNGSNDGSSELFEKEIADYSNDFRSIKISKNAENRGFGAGHNAAIKHGDGELVFLLNHDSELKPDCLKILVDEAMSDRGNTVAWEARQAPFEHPKIYNPVTLETSWISGAGFLVRRSAYEKIGGFDEKIFLYGEDVDLSWRLRDNGWKLRYIPKAVFLHHTYDSPEQTKPAQFIGSIRANLYLRTRFGTWNDIAVGFLKHISLLIRPSRQYIEKQRFLVLKGIVKWIINFRHFRNGSHRKVDHTFYGWEYEIARIGAFHDISDGINIKNPPKVSVLIRTMGKQNILKSALKSIENQTYKNIETVVIEDGKETLKEFLGGFDTLDIKYNAFGKNKGRCVAGNKAMKIASGEYFIFLDEDDMLYADHIEQLVGGILKNKAKVAYSFAFELPSEYTENGIGKEGEYFSRFKEKFSFLRLLDSNYIPIHTVLFHKSLPKKAGGFDTTIEYNEDWNLWVRFSLESRPFVVLPKTTAIYRVPMENHTNKDRHKIMVRHQQLVREKQSSLKLETTVGELIGLVPDAHIIGLEEMLIQRLPRIQSLIKLTASIYRKFHMS